MSISVKHNKNLLIFFILTLLLASPDIIYHAINGRWLEMGLSYGICSALFACPLYLFRSTLRAYVWLMLPFGLIAIISISSVIIYNVNFNFDVFLVVLNTTLQEATELAKAYYVYILIAIGLYLAIYFYLLKTISNRINPKKAKFASIGGIIFLIFTPIIRPGLSSYVDQLKINISDFYPGSIYYAAKIFAHQRSIVSDYTEKTKNFQFKAFPKSAVDAKQIYVLVIGETGRYDHWAINGYPRPTSPLLAKRQQQTVSFTDLSTGAYLTEYSVPMLITRATPQNYNLHYEEKSIVSLFKEAGFKTYWLSNQFDYGNIQIHAMEADSLISLSTSYEATKSIHLDLDLVDVLRKVLTKNEKKVFIVMHTLGSHFDYDARYPDSYIYFKPTAKSVNARPTDYSQKQVLINSYDNSIRYTDTVLDSTISLVSQTKALSWVSYVADHGEELFDDDRKLSQHGNPVPSKYIAHIPWFIWTSDAYKRNFSTKVLNLERNKSVPVGSQNIFYTLADLGNIGFTGEDSTKSASANALKPQPQLILGGNSKVFNAKSFDSSIK